MSETVYLSHISYSVSSIAFPGQKESGDLHVIKEMSEKVLIAVVDGAGHGHEAAIAAKLAVNTLNSYSDLSIIKLVKLCHEKLKNTRGAVMALASINYTDETLTWLSIGNVEGMLLRADSEIKPIYESIFMCSGLVGYRISQLYANIIPISKGDLLILTTDGIRSDYVMRIAADSQSLYRRSALYSGLSKDEMINESLIGQEETALPKMQMHSEDLSLFLKGVANTSPQEVTEYITGRFVKGSDDALVATVKYLGKE